MADEKITQLTDLTTPANEDLLVIVDDPSGSPITKKITRENLLKTDVKFRASRTAAQTIPDSSWTKVELNSEDFDIGGNFDPTTNYRFTVPTTGYYFFTGQASLDSPGDGTKVALSLYKNGSGVSRATVITGANLDIGASVSDILYLAATDYIELYIWHNAGSSKNLGAASDRTYLSGFRLR